METRRNLEAKLIETASAKETVLYANTAQYLFERLKRDASVSYVAHELSTDEILGWLKEKTANAPESPQELVRAYVFLVALSLKDDLNKNKDQFGALDLKQVEWAEQIRQLILNERVPTSYSSVVYQNAGSTIISSATTSGHSSGIVLVPGKDFQ